MRPAIWSPTIIVILFLFVVTGTVRPLEIDGARANTTVAPMFGPWNEAPNAQPPPQAEDHASGVCRTDALADLCIREADSGEPKPPAQNREPSNTCMEMTGLPPLESASTVQKSPRLVVEAVLRDAETIYAEGARLVGRKPRTESEAVALSKMSIMRVGGESFPITECNFQFALSRTMQVGEAKFPKDMALTLERIGQFDNLIYDAVRQALTCSNTQAQFELNLSRQALDHAKMEFNGHLEQRNWNPGAPAGPQTHEACVDNLPKGIGLAALAKIIDAEIQKFQKDTP
jgi:hypothetical protein